MSDAAQLALGFGHDAAMGAADFLVAESNAQAVGWLRRWPHWPTPALVLYGPAGCGKSHLARIFASRSKGRLLTFADLAACDPPALVADAPVCVLDDAELCSEAGVETALLHLFNVIAESGRGLLLTARCAPARWRIDLPDLRSRLNAACAAGIDLPDDELMRAVLGKLFVDRQLRVGEDVLSYLLARMERSLNAARLLAERIDAAALAAQRPVTVPLVRAVLRAEMEGRGS